MPLDHHRLRRRSLHLPLLLHTSRLHCSHRHQLRWHLPHLIHLLRLRNLQPFLRKMSASYGMAFSYDGPSAKVLLWPSVRQYP